VALYMPDSGGGRSRHRHAGLRRIGAPFGGIWWLLRKALRDRLIDGDVKSVDHRRWRFPAKEQGCGAQPAVDQALAATPFAPTVDHVLVVAPQPEQPTARQQARAPLVARVVEPASSEHTAECRMVHEDRACLCSTTPDPP